jgi:membrane associated rhomboid family serine protease
MYPRTGLVIFPLPIPLPAIAVCAAYLAYDIYSSFNRRIGDNVGHVAHIGGAMVNQPLI